nr:uncharacterized protein LOC123759586 [Procambarus clarkii]
MKTNRDKYNIYIFRPRRLQSSPTSTSGNVASKMSVCKLRGTPLLTVLLLLVAVGVLLEMEAPQATPDALTIQDHRPLRSFGKDGRQGETAVRVVPKSVSRPKKYGLGVRGPVNLYLDMGGVSGVEYGDDDTYGVSGTEYADAFGFSGTEYAPADTYDVKYDSQFVTDGSVLTYNQHTKRRKELHSNTIIRKIRVHIEIDAFEELVDLLTSFTAHCSVVDTSQSRLHWDAFTQRKYTQGSSRHHRGARSRRKHAQGGSRHRSGARFRRKHAQGGSRHRWGARSRRKHTQGGSRHRSGARYRRKHAQGGSRHRRDARSRRKDAQGDSRRRWGARSRREDALRDSKHRRGARLRRKNGPGGTIYPCNVHSFNERNRNALASNTKRLGKRYPRQAWSGHEVISSKTNATMTDATVIKNVTKTHLKRANPTERSVGRWPARTTNGKEVENYQTVTVDGHYTFLQDLEALNLHQRLRLDAKFDLAELNSLHKYEIIRKLLQELRGVLVRRGYQLLGSSTDGVDLLQYLRQEGPQRPLHVLTLWRRHP